MERATTALGDLISYSIYRSTGELDLHYVILMDKVLLANQATDPRDFSLLLTTTNIFSWIILYVFKTI